MLSTVVIQLSESFLYHAARSLNGRGLRATCSPSTARDAKQFEHQTDALRWADEQRVINASVAG